jgi:hypothetical protein
MSIPTPPNGMVSNTELILRKILGEDVTPLPPNSRVEFYLIQVKEYIERLATGATRPIGETTTPLIDGATTNPILIDGDEYTVQINDLVFYGNKEFLFTANGWREVGDLTNINADMIDDSTTTNKFTNATEKETWNGKQDAIDTTHKLSADLVDDSTAANKFVTATDITKLGKFIVDPSFTGNFYVSSTAPTGNIPDGSVGVGW